MSGIVFLYATAPDEATARHIGAALVNARLAACVNVLPAVWSVYRWNDAIESGNETSFLVKTTAEQAPAACAEILRLHPYETPCVAALPVDAMGSNAGYLDWIRRESGVV